MVIPKKRAYRLHLLLIGFCIALSGLVVTSAAITAQALTTPPSYGNHDDAAPPSSRAPDGGFTQNEYSQGTNTNTNSQSNSSNQTQTTSVQPQKSVNQEASVQQTTATSGQIVTRPVQKAALPAAVVSQPFDAPSPETAVDTSSQSAAVAVAQAAKTSQPLPYVSTKIPSNERDKLYRVSIITSVFGFGLYILSYASAAWRWASRTQTPAFSPKILTE